MNKTIQTNPARAIMQHTRKVPDWEGTAAVSALSVQCVGLLCTRGLDYFQIQTRISSMIPPNKTGGTTSRQL